MEKFNDGDESAFAERILERDEAAVREFDTFRPDLERILVGAIGASATEASDIAGDVFSDCRLPTGPLSKYAGKGTLRGFLVTVARNKFTDTKRRITPESIDDPDRPLDALSGGAEESEFAEDRITAILRESVMDAFAHADPEGLLVMRLVEAHGLTRRMLTPAWDCHEATIGRMFESCRESMRKAILDGVSEREPLLDLEWEDFLRLCENSTDLFGGGSGADEGGTSDDGEGVAK